MSVTQAPGLLHPPPMTNRHSSRYALKVIHRHRKGEETARRVSELVFINGRAKAILGWIDLGRMRTPIYMPDLDADKLHRLSDKNTYFYDEVTEDPRYDDARPVQGSV
jgi:hypothetical protein